MLPITQASVVSRLRTDVPHVHGELRTYLRTEYNGDGAAVIAAVQRARGAARARTNARAFRTVVEAAEALARIAAAIAAALTAPGGA
jgi:hypothetical protein